MTEPDAHPIRGATVYVKRYSNTRVSREYVQSLRGKLKGKGLLKAVMEEKEKERRY